MFLFNNRKKGKVAELNSRITGHELREVQMSSEIQDQHVLISSLRLAEERSAVLAAIVDSSDDAIISKDLNGLVTSWNLSAQRIFGYTASEMIGHSITKLIPNDRMDEESHILSKLRSGERVDHFETVRQRSDGKLINVSLTISPVKDFKGNIIGVSKIARDISSIKLATEKSLIMSAIVESTDDAVISKNLHGIVMSWNPSAQRMFGYTAEEMIGQSIMKLIPADRQQEEPQIISRLKQRQRVDHFETKRITKYGKLLDVSLTISPVIDASGEIIGVSKIARDITDKKLEEERKNDFIAIVSHELKTPLTSIRSYVQLALVKASERKDAFSQTVLKRAETQTHKMSTMIHDFLNLSRLEEGKMSLNLSEFSLRELLDEAISESQLLSPDHIIDYEPCVELSIKGDREKLGQVVSNLLGNAVKYSPINSRIVVSCSLQGGLTTIRVKDEGLGISKEDQTRLFERFYRVKNGKENSISGFGIGLYLVAEILKMHGSKITVESAVGKGSLFSFSLPVETVSTS